MSVVVLITARGGSKGLPRKNILPLNGKPLIAWTILSGLKSKIIDRVFVSSEDQEILNVSVQFGAEIIKRPESLAQDDTSSEPVIEHFIQELDKRNIYFEHVILLQPTSPLRQSLDIDEAYEVFIEHDASCVISVFEPKHTPAKAYQLLNDGSIAGLMSLDAPYTRRQDLPVTFQPNGAIYVFSKNKFIQKKRIPRENVFPYLMSEELSLDVDTIDDLKACETIMRDR